MCSGRRFAQGGGEVVVTNTRADAKEGNPTEGDSSAVPDHSVQLTCAGCGFLVMTSSFAAATGLGWRVVLPEHNRGLCPNCAKNV